MNAVDGFSSGITTDAKKKTYDTDKIQRENEPLLKDYRTETANPEEGAGNENETGIYGACDSHTEFQDAGWYTCIYYTCTTNTNARRQLAVQTHVMQQAAR